MHAHRHVNRDDEQMLGGNTLEGRKSHARWIRGARAEHIGTDRELHQTQEVTELTHTLMRLHVN